MKFRAAIEAEHLLTVAGVAIANQTYYEHYEMGWHCNPEQATSYGWNATSTAMDSPNMVM